MKTRTKIIVGVTHAIFFVWLSVFNILLIEDYKWDWSNNDGILAIQYLINGAWYLSTVALPVWALVGTIGIFTNWFQD